MGWFLMEKWMMMFEQAHKTFRSATKALENSLKLLPRWRRCFVCGVALSVLTCSPAQAGGDAWASSPAPDNANLPPSDHLVVEKVVMLMRHGETSAEPVEEIGSPSDQTMADTERFNSPLTADARTALIMWGQFHRRRLESLGMLPQLAPLGAHDLAMLVSPPLRTRMSAAAFLEGLAPDSQIGARYEGTRLWYNFAMNDGAARDVAVIRDVVIATGNIGLLIDYHGAILMEQLSEAVLNRQGPDDASVVLYMGHRDNVNTIRSFIGFDWHAPQQVPNHIDYGGALIFERVRSLRDHQRYVRISYMAPTWQQVVRLRAPSETAPPFAAVFEPPTMGLRPRDADLIPVRRFTEMAEEMRRLAFLPFGLRTDSRRIAPGRRSATHIDVMPIHTTGTAHRPLLSNTDMDVAFGVPTRRSPWQFVPTHEPRGRENISPFSR